MALQRFGNFYIQVDKIVYVHRFDPQINPPSLSLPGTNALGGVRIFFESQDLTINEDEPGYAEFVNWLGNEKL